MPDGNYRTTSESGLEIPKWLVQVLWLVREVGLSGTLIGVIVYLLLVQFPEMRNDFRIQTDKVIESSSRTNNVVDRNSRVMEQVNNELRALRNDRWFPWPPKEK